MLRVARARACVQIVERAQDAGTVAIEAKWDSIARLQALAQLVSRNINLVYSYAPEDLRQRFMSVHGRAILGYHTAAEYLTNRHQGLNSR